MKETILEVLGKDHTDTIQFDEDNGYNEPYGCYTFKGGVYVLMGGMDVDFNDLTDVQKKRVSKIVKSNNWKINKSLQ